MGLPGSGAAGPGLGARLPHLCPRLLLAAGSHLQRGVLTLNRLAQWAPQLPDRAPVSAGPGAQQGGSASFPGRSGREPWTRWGPAWWWAVVRLAPPTSGVSTCSPPTPHQPLPHDAPAQLPQGRTAGPGIVCQAWARLRSEALPHRARGHRWVRGHGGSPGAPGHPGPIGPSAHTGPSPGADAQGLSHQPVRPEPAASLPSQRLLIHPLPRAQPDIPARQTG